MDRAVGRQDLVRCTLQIAQPYISPTCERYRFFIWGNRRLLIAGLFVSAASPFVSLQGLEQRGELDKVVTNMATARTWRPGEVAEWSKASVC